VRGQRVTLAWTDNSHNENEFRVAVSRDGGQSWTNVGTVNANQTAFQVTGLEPESRYWFRVQAFNRHGHSEYTSAVEVVTSRLRPAQPSNLYAMAVGGRSVDLAWTDNSNNEQAFRIAISRDGGNSWDNIGTVAANQTMFQATGLEPETSYWFKVRAANEHGYSEVTNVVHAVTTQLRPADPSNAHVTYIDPTTVELAWADNSNNEQAFRIAISRDGGNSWDNVGVVGPNQTSFRATGLHPGTNYWFKVRAANDHGYSQYTNVVHVATPVPPILQPVAPSHLFAADVHRQSVDLAWTDNSNNEQEFRIAISRDGGRTWDNIGVVGTNQTGFRAKDLQPNTRYWFKVRAAFNGVYSDYSNVVEVRTKG
jgi:chitodextrinase